MQDYVDVEEADLSAELIRRLRHLEHFVPPEQMGEIWIFPPLEQPEGTREFVLFTRMEGEEARQVYSARDRRREEDGESSRVSGDGGAATANGGGPASAVGNGHASANGQPPGAGGANGRPTGGVADDDGAGANGSGPVHQAIVAHGRAPAGRLPGLVESLLRRLGDQRAPVHVAVEGSRGRWDDLVNRVAGEAATSGN